MKHTQSIYRFSTIAVVLAAMVLCLPAGSAWADPDMGGHHGMEMQGHGSMGGHGGYGHHGMRPHNAAAHFLKMADMLGLSDDQTAKLVKMRDDYIAKNATSEEQLAAAYGDLPRLLYADEIDLKKVDALLDKTGKLESQLWHAFAQQLHDIKAMLTPDQKAALNELHQMRHEGMGSMHHGDMPMHGDM